MGEKTPVFLKKTNKLKCNTLFKITDLTMSWNVPTHIGLSVKSQ